MATSSAAPAGWPTRRSTTTARRTCATPSARSQSTRGKRAWRQAAAAISEYRIVYRVTDPERALGPAPREAAQRADWQRTTAAVERVWHKQRVAERARMEPTTGGREVRLQEHRRGVALQGRGSAEPPKRQQHTARARPERDTPAGQGAERAAG